MILATISHMIFNNDYDPIIVEFKRKFDLARDPQFNLL